MPAVVPMLCSAAAAADVHFEGSWGTGQVEGPSGLAALWGTPPLLMGCSCWGMHGPDLRTGGDVNAPGHS